MGGIYSKEFMRGPARPQSGMTQRGKKKMRGLRLNIQQRFNASSGNVRPETKKETSRRELNEVLPSERVPVEEGPSKTHLSGGREAARSFIEQTSRKLFSMSSFEGD